MRVIEYRVRKFTNMVPEAKKEKKKMEWDRVTTE